MDVLVVIPARLGSARLPGKALADVAGIPLIERVRRAAILADVGPVLVATDSPAIADVVRAHGGDVALTGPAGNGTLRVAEAARGRAGSVIVNVQGDQPLLDPAHVRAVAEGIPDPGVCAIATLSCPWPPDVPPEDPHRVKVWVDPAGRALDFARSVARAGPFGLHLGLYAFTRAAIDRVTSLPVGDRAVAEGLEQLTWLEAGLPIHVVRVGPSAPAVDTPEGLALVRRILGG